MDNEIDLMDVIAQLEEEYNWRVLELNELKNQLAFITSEAKRKIYRKSLVVMLYSHFEGFCKAAFHIYLNSLNRLNLNRGEVVENLQATSMNEIFLEYHNESRKEVYFKKDLPDDSKLHRYARQITFIKNLDQFKIEKLSLPESIIDTESNLKPIVLRKILFRLGFDYECLKSYEGNVHRLLNKRNSIAHGSQKEGIEAKEFSEIEQDVLGVMNEVRLLIFNALEQRTYLKNKELENRI